MKKAVFKMRESRRKNVLKRAMIIQNIVAEYYEPGNQSKSKAQAYRHHISKIYPMGERTFWRYMGMDVKQEMKNAQNGQLEFNFD